MAAQPLKAGLPPNCTLSAGYVVRLVALHPTTGANVAGVTLSDISFFVTDLNAAGAAGGGGESGPLPEPGPLLVPLDDNA